MLPAAALRFRRNITPPLFIIAVNAVNIRVHDVGLFPLRACAMFTLR